MSWTPMLWPSALQLLRVLTSRIALSPDGMVSLGARGAVSSNHRCAPALAHRCFLHATERHVAYLCSILDGYIRLIVHLDLRDRLRKRRSKSFCNERGRNIPKRKPRSSPTTDHSSLPRDFKEFIRHRWDGHHVQPHPSIPKIERET